MIDFSKVLIIGRDSAIAQEIPFGIKLSHKELDITDINQIKDILVKYNPSAVICLASIDINNSEKNPSQALEVNTIGLYNVAVRATKINLPVILISTGAIFNGSINEQFDEKSAPNPLNIYGQTKYLAEIILQQTTSNFLIVRTGWLFGFKHKKGGFSKFIDKILNAEDASRITATEDSIGSPTYIIDFVNALKELIHSGKKGIFHIVNLGRASAYDVAREAASIVNKKKIIEAVKTNLEIVPRISTRSKSEALLSNKLNLRSWQEALRDYAKIKSI